MANDKESTNYDYNAQLLAQLTEAIRLLAERVTPRALDKSALDAIKKHDELKESLQFVFQVTPAPPTGKY